MRAKSLVAGIGANAAKEDPDLPLPPLQIGAKQWLLLLVPYLDRREGLGPPAPDEQATLRARAKVPRPLGVPTRRHQVSAALKREQVDGRATPLPLLRPRTSRMRAPATLIPRRVSPATPRLKTCLVNQPGR